MLQPAPGFQLLSDLPTLTHTFPHEVAKAHAGSQRAALITWRDNPKAPGVAFRFTWAASKPMNFGMRRRKYGAPTSLRVHYAKQGFPMPAQRMPGSRARPGPNRDKPWYVQSGTFRAEALSTRPKTIIANGQVSTRMRIKGKALGVLGGNTMRGVATAHWVKVPKTYPMKVYKDAVGRTGAYTMMVTRGIGRWFISYKTTTYRQEFEDTTQDLPWIQRLADAELRVALRDLVIDDRGRVKLRYRKAHVFAGELALLQEAS
jgi:hypothetical protein